MIATTTSKSRAKKPRLGQKTPGTLAAVVIPTTSHEEASVPNYAPLHDRLGTDGTVKLEDAPAVGSEQWHPSNSDQAVAARTGNGVRESDGHTRPSILKRQESLLGIKQPASSTRSTPSRGQKAKTVNNVDQSIDETYHNTTAQSENKPSSSRHKRFGSEEANLDTPPPGELGAQRAVRDSGSESSEDEAPELVSKTTGQQEARSAAAEATKAADAQRAIEKQKRRNRDRLLKSQVKASNNKGEKAARKDERLQASNGNDRFDGQFPPSPIAGDSQFLDEDALPALLPDEILAAEPAVRLPTPPAPSQLDVAKATINHRRRFLEQTSQPPKDMRKGKVRIRVLEDHKAVLPPRISKNSQLLRESWLAGRLGPKGRVVMERRRIGTGFIRR